jgi:zeaxanthin glucosyltransferase
LTGATPPSLFPWPYETTPEALAKYAEGAQQLGQYLGGLAQLGVAYAEKTGTVIDWSDPAALNSKLAILSQIPREFDFPGIPWPPQFHYTGPFHDDQGRAPVPFPWEKINGKPIIYASLGTLVNGLDYVYKAILGAVGPMQDVQLVLSIGKNIRRDDLGPVPENTIVVESAPQIALLKRASLCITHAGLNTTLESLAQGVPMVAIPIAYEQPGVAARIAYHGAGEVVPLEDLTAARLSEQIQKVRTIPTYREKARFFQKVIAERHGLDTAAEIVEQAFNLKTADLTREYAEVSRA